MISGKELVPGKMYTFCGKKNVSSWTLYSKCPSMETAQIVTNLLWPLEPFVFLKRISSDIRYNEDDNMYNYMILTGTGVLGWLCLHDDDLKAFGISFCEYIDE